MKRLGLVISDNIGLPSAFNYIEKIVEKGKCKIALDIGCGGSSHLTRLRPKVITVGVDAFPPAIEVAKSKNAHDFYIIADVLKDGLHSILAQFNGKKFDLVTMIGVIEHFPKSDGYRLLKKCEELTEKYIILETPNGYLEQGPEFGNEYQRHLSGWFQHEFEGYGYKVYGTTGTKYLRGYAAGRKYNFAGALSCDVILARLLRVDRRPRHAFNLLAVKDVRGVPNKLG